MAVFFKQETIDTTIHELIRLELVKGNYLPNRLLFNDVVSYKQALAALKLSNKSPQFPDGYLIDVLSVNNYSIRGDRGYHQITIDKIGIREGGIGSWGLSYTIPDNNNKYTSKYYSSSTCHIEYQITYLTDNRAIDNIISTLLYGLFAFKSYKPTFDKNRQKQNACIFITHIGDFDNSNGAYIEKGIRIQVKDIYIFEGQTLEEGLVPMTKFKSELEF